MVQPLSGQRCWLVLILGSLLRHPSCYSSIRHIYAVLWCNITWKGCRTHYSACVYTNITQMHHPYTFLQLGTIHCQLLFIMFDLLPKKIDDSTNAHHIEALKEHEQLTQIPFALLIQLPSSSTFATPFTTPSSSPFFLPLSGEESANNGRVKLL